VPTSTRAPRHREHALSRAEDLAPRARIDDPGAAHDESEGRGGSDDPPAGIARAGDCRPSTPILSRAQCLRLTTRVTQTPARPVAGTTSRPLPIGDAVVAPLLTA